MLLSKRKKKKRIFVIYITNEELIDQNTTLFFFNGQNSCVTTPPRITPVCRQFNTKLLHHYRPTRAPKIKTTDHTECWKRNEVTKNSCNLHKGVNRTTTLEKSLASCTKVRNAHILASRNATSKLYSKNMDLHWIGGSRQDPQREDLLPEAGLQAASHSQLHYQMLQRPELSTESHALPRPAAHTHSCLLREAGFKGLTLPALGTHYQTCLPGFLAFPRYCKTCISVQLLSLPNPVTIPFPNGVLVSKTLCILWVPSQKVLERLTYHHRC